MPLQYNITVEKDENAAYITDINKTNIDSMSNKAIKVNLTDANVDINESIETLKKMEEKQVDSVASTTKTEVSTTKTEVSPTKTEVSPTKTEVSTTNTEVSTTNTVSSPTNTVSSTTNTVSSPTNTVSSLPKSKENQSNSEGNQDNNDDDDGESMRNLSGNEELGGGRNKQSRRLRRIVKHKTGKHKGGKKTRSSNKKYRSTRKIHKR